MVNSQKTASGSNRFGMLILIGLAASVFLAGVTFDLSEKLWAGTRALETVQFDELLLAMLVLLVVSLMIAVRRISALKAEIEAFQSTIDKLPQTSAGSDYVGEYLIKCVGCGKFQVHGEPWLDREGFAAHTQRAEAFGGVCPDCRGSSKKQSLEARRC